MPLVDLVDPERIKGELGRRSFKEFITSFWSVTEANTPFLDNWHIDCFVDHLVHIREIRNLLVTVPPGTSKSLVFGVFFPAWLWLHEPQTRFLYASYSLSLSIRDSVKCRRLISSPLYQKCFANIYQITGDVDKKDHFENDKTGFRQAISVGGTTKGLKGNFLIGDDLLNADATDSETKKKVAIDWFADSFYDRLNDFNKDCRLVIGQRIARDDLAGFILDNYKESWHHLNLPYEYKPTTYVSVSGWRDPRTEEGEALWPARFPANEINQLKRKQRSWSSQWNQNPTDSEAALFKSDWFRYYDQTSENYRLNDRTISKHQCFRIAAVDWASATDRRADYTAIVVADVAPSGEIVVVHVLREKLSGTKLVPALVGINEAFRPAYMIVEEANSHILSDQGKAEGIPLRRIKPRGSKEERSLPLQIRMESGQVWFPKNVGWLSAVESELLEFPNGLHDDVLDALAHLATEAGKRTRHRPEQNMIKVKTQQQVYHEAVMAGLF